MDIITLTLNPAFDKHCYTKDFKLGHESFFEVLSNDAGGKGINITRALKEVGINSKAIIALGSKSKDDYKEALDKYNIDYTIIDVNGKVRENIILHDNSNIETRVSFNGTKIDNDLLDKVEEILLTYPNNSIITLTGSNPLGVDNLKVKELAIKLVNKGYKLVIDNRSFTINDLLEIKPFLIKPNIDELEIYLNKKLSSLEDVKNEIAVFNEKGIENVIVSLGDKGAIYATKNNYYYGKVDNIKAISTIGAGDSMIAGFIYGYINNKNEQELLKYALSFGSAKCLQSGTNPPCKKDIDKLYEEIKLL